MSRELRLIQNFKIADQSIGAGERKKFQLEMARLYTDTPLNTPVEVIRGHKDGPTLLVCAAIHGDELNGTEIIRRLSQLPALRRLRGTLVLVSVVNAFGFIHRSRYLPDRRDLNRCFPGSSTGSLGSRIANKFFTEVVQQCSHVIDLHTAAIHRDNHPQIRANMDDPAVEAMALSFSIPVIINANLLDNSLRSEANGIGIPVITYEAGEALRFDESSIVTGVRGIVNVMRGLQMLPPSRSTRAKAEPYIANSSSWVRAPCDGMFRTVTNLGAMVDQDQILGYVSSPAGDQDTPVTTKTEGILIGMNRLPLVNEGEALFHVARFGEVAAVEEEIGSHASTIEADPLFEGPISVS